MLDPLYPDTATSRPPPRMTWLIAAACAVVMFGCESQDAARDQKAFEFYRQSGLQGIELPRYQAYLTEHQDPLSAYRLQRLRAAAPDGPETLELIQTDGRFMASLRAYQVVHPDEAICVKWRADRARFDVLANASVPARYALVSVRAGEVWRFLTYAFVHADLAHFLGTMLILALAGPLLEAVIGSSGLLLVYTLGAAIAGAVHVVVSDDGLIGASGATAASVGMLAGIYGRRRVTVFSWQSLTYGRLAGLSSIRLPALLLLPVWLVSELCLWSLQPSPGRGGGAALYRAYAGADYPSLYWAPLGGICVGLALAWLLRPRTGWAEAAGLGAADGELGTSGRAVAHSSSLAAQAQAAAARLDIRLATRYYRELAEIEPDNIEYLGEYLSTTLLGTDAEAIQDAALRLLWFKRGKTTEALRRTFLQLTQSKVLAALPVDEHLRLARRLVRFREDAAALRLIDAILQDDHLRELYGRQIADCLLAVFTVYTRHGLRKPAEHVRSRLSSYFPEGAQIGGVAPSHRPPPSILSSLHPSAQLSFIATDSRLAQPPPDQAARQPDPA